ncbi:hypothetical protein FGG08_002037 [Glutinoglossum americanum]|uniref:Aromatic-L-amino-acid decarboxylase n=1 Tax=Glutinoglossum americanum TaxID=1670608 RepID=A0A9P8KZM5_9PEZI|nr:hypothetical protein FGG08_002037 [Glutinoglossum americanum]
MDSAQFRKAAHAAIDEIINYYDTIGERRVVSEVEPGYLRKILPDGPPQEGEKWEDIQKDIEAKIMPGLTHWQHPNFMAWFPASSTYPGMLGELYSSAFTTAAFNWLCSPAVTELETVVLDWLAKLLNLPASFLSSGEGGGVVQGSASEAIVTVMVAARDKYLRESTAHLEGAEREIAIAEKRGRLVALGSEMAHSSTQKAALIAGTRFRAIPAGLEDNFGLTGKNFREIVDQCLLEGLEPFYLTASLGTTATCAVDNFGEIAEVLRDHPAIWVHVDAAYAGAALVCEEYQQLTHYMDNFDSFDMNMHKWLLTNFDASCLFVKRRRHLIDALSVTPSYLRNEFSDSGLVTDYRDWQIPLGRRFRALKIWFVMRTYGVEGLKNHIRNTVKLGELFCSMIQSRPDLFKVLTPPAFALTVLCVVPHSKSPASASVPQPKAAREAYSNSFTPDATSQALIDSNLLTKQVYEAVNSRAEIFVTGVVVKGTYAIRVVSANPKAEEKYIRRAFEILVEVAEEVRNQVGGKGMEPVRET